jgi:hypothetical protein
MFLKQLDQIVFQIAVSTTAYTLVMNKAHMSDFGVLRKTSCLREVDQIAFALALQPIMRHGYE